MLFSDFWRVNFTRSAIYIYIYIWTHTTQQGFNGVVSCRNVSRVSWDEEIAPEPKSFILLSPLVCFFFCLFFSTPIGEWLSPLQTQCRTCKTPPSTATMTVAWRSPRHPAASRHLARALDPWPCLRTTTREPLRMEALAKTSTLRTVRSVFEPLALH